jgi:hypothetical protein
MKKPFITIFTAIILIYNFSNAQDSLNKNPILTKEFNLSTEYLQHIVKNSGKSNPLVMNSLYEDCNIVIPYTDSSFKISHEGGRSLILYKDIKQISFRGKSKFGTGLWQGAIFGALAGAVIVAGILSTKEEKADPSKGSVGIGIGISKVYSAIILPPAFAFIGAIIGGTVGAVTYEYKEYDFKKISVEEKKTRALKLFKKYRPYL